MTNTKFRKRALLSSVAMLLVALVALGSATFAWFSADPNAKTKGLDLKAQSSTGLLIQSGTEKTVDSTWWSHEALLNAKSKSGSTWTANDAISIGAASQEAASGTSAAHKIFRVDAASDGASAADTNKAVTEASAGTDYYEENLYLKVTGAASANVDIKKVTLTNTNTDIGKAVRVAILSSDLKTLYGIWKPSAGTDNKYLTATAANFSSSLEAGPYSGKASASAQTISIGSIGNDGSNYVVLRVYIDGEDANVYSLNIAQADLSSILSSVVVEFKIHE